MIHFDFNKAQRIVIYLFCIVTVISMYYTVNLGDQSRILNDNSTSKFFDREDMKWLSIGNEDIAVFYTEASLFSIDNFFGLTYEISVFMRDSKTKKGLRGPGDVPIRLKNQEDGVRFVQHGESDLFTLVFETPLWSPKNIVLLDQKENEIIIQTNPFLIFQSFVFSTIGLVLTVAFTITLFIYTAYTEAAFVFLSSLGLSMLANEYTHYQLFGYLFLVITVIRFKMSTVILIHLAKYLLDKRIIVVVYALCYAYLQVDVSFEWRHIIGCFFLAFPLMALVYLIVYASSSLVYKFYMYFRYPCIPIKSIEIQYTDYEKELEELRQRGVDVRRRVPEYIGRVTVNSKVVIRRITILMDLYTALKKGKTIPLSYYKTDGKGNYIFLK